MKESNYIHLLPLSVCLGFGDKGYISKKLFEEMMGSGVKIVTSLRSKMKTKIIELEESQWLKKRSVIESVFYILKDILHINHTRHRRPANFLINLIGSLCVF